MKPFLPAVVTVLFAGSLAACASSGGDGPAETADRLLFSDESGLWLVHPASPADPELVVASSGSGFSDFVIYERLAPGGAPGLRLVAMVSLESGGLFRVSARGGDPLTPVKVSTETDYSVTATCGWFIGLLWHFSESDPMNSALVYGGQPASGGVSCPPSHFKMVRFGMGPRDAPIDVPFTPIAPGFSLYTTVGTPSYEFSQFPRLTNGAGRTVGWLAIDGSALVRCDLNFTTCSTVTPFQTSVRNLDTGSGWAAEFDTHYVLQVDGAVRIYDASAGELGPPRYAFSSDQCPLSPEGGVLCRWAFTEGEDVYVFDEGRYLRGPVTGTSALTPVFPDPGALGFSGFTTNRLVYLVRMDGSIPTFLLKAIAKRGDAVSTLVDETADPVQVVFTLGSRVYYQHGLTFGVVNDDGTGRLELADAKYAGSINGQVILVRGCSTTSCAGGAVGVYDSEALGRVVALGVLPADVSAIQFAGSSLGAGAVGGVRDVFYADTLRANSLVRVTNTPAVDERVLGTYFPSN